MDNNDNYFPSINWDYFYYIGPGVAVALMLCMLASYCCQYCSRKNRGYTDSYHTSTTQTRQRRSNVTQGQRGNSSANRPAVADPFVYHQFVPWNSPRRSNQQTLNGNQTANYNYPPSTNPHFAAQTDAPRTGTQPQASAPALDDLVAQNEVHTDSPPSYSTAIQHQYSAPGTTASNTADQTAQPQVSQAMTDLPPAYGAGAPTDHRENRNN